MSVRCYFEIFHVRGAVKLESACCGGNNLDLREPIGSELSPEIVNAALLANRVASFIFSVVWRGLSKISSCNPGVAEIVHFENLATFLTASKTVSR